MLSVKAYGAVRLPLSMPLLMTSCSVKAYVKCQARAHTHTHTHTRTHTHTHTKNRCVVEHKYASVIGRLAKLWMAYKREKRRLQSQRRDERFGQAPPAEP